MSKLTVLFIFLNGWENKPNKKNTLWCKKIDEIKIVSGHSHARHFCMAACELQRHSWAVVTETVWPEIIWPISKNIKDTWSWTTFYGLNPNSGPEVHTQSLIAVLTTPRWPRWEREDPEPKVMYPVWAKEKESQPSSNPSGLVRPGAAV